MIIRSSWIALGDMPRHLAREDTNRKVEVVMSAGRACAGDIEADLQLFDAISQTNHRVRRTLVHVRIAPERPVSDDELLALIELTERHHGIPSDQPRIVVRHAKGDRAEHFHVLWPTVCSDGRSVKSHDNYLRDEVISRTAELLRGERLIPGPRTQQVITHFLRSGQNDKAAALERAPPRDLRPRMGDGAYNMAARVGADIDQLKSTILDLWIAHGAGPQFAAALRSRGFRLAAGDKETGFGPTVMVLQDATGLSAPLRRTILAAAKARSLQLQVSPSELRAFTGLQPLKVARDAGLKDALEIAFGVHQREGKLLEAEALEDEDLETVRFAQKALPQPAPITFKQTLKARRETIRDHYRMRDNLRRKRVDRAFSAAGIFGDRRLRNIAFAAAAAGVLLSGGGLGLALIAGGVVRALLPSRELARSIAKAANIERRRDREAQALEMHQAYAAVRAEFRGQKRRIAPVRESKPTAADGQISNTPIAASPTRPRAPLGRARPTALPAKGRSGASAETISGLLPHSPRGVTQRRWIQRKAKAAGTFAMSLRQSQTAHVPADKVSRKSMPKSQTKEFSP